MTTNFLLYMVKFTLTLWIHIMWFAFLGLGTLWFWLALVLPFLFLIFFVEQERSGWAFSTILITLALFAAFGDKNLVPWVMNHPIDILEYAGAYVLAGIVWGFIRWYFYILTKRDDYVKFRTDWIASNGELSDQPFPSGYTKQTVRQKFQADAAAKDLPPRVDHNKGRLTFWMSYWPASAVWTLLNDPLSRIGRFLYNRLGHLFQHISNAMFAKYSDDFRSR